MHVGSFGRDGTDPFPPRRSGYRDRIVLRDAPRCSAVRGRAPARSSTRRARPRHEPRLRCGRALLRSNLLRCRSEATPREVGGRRAREEDPRRSPETRLGRSHGSPPARTPHRRRAPRRDGVARRRLRFRPRGARGRAARARQRSILAARRSPRRARRDARSRCGSTRRGSASPVSSSTAFRSPCVPTSSAHAMRRAPQRAKKGVKIRGSAPALVCE